MFTAVITVLQSQDKQTFTKKKASIESKKKKQVPCFACLASENANVTKEEFFRAMSIQNNFNFT